MTSPGRKLITVFTTALVMWLVAGLWHNLIMPRLYADRHANHEGLGLLAAAYLVLAALMLCLYPTNPRRRHHVGQGFVYGAVIGVLWVFPHGLAMAGAHGESLGYLLRNSLWHVLEQGLGGAVLFQLMRSQRVKGHAVSAS